MINLQMFVIYDSMCISLVLHVCVVIFQKSPSSTENFDQQFVSVPIKMTPPDWLVLQNCRGDEFSDFSCMNYDFRHSDGDSTPIVASATDISSSS
jgi:hypothetical protein